MSELRYELINKNTGEVVPTGLGPNGVAGTLSQGSSTFYLVDGTPVVFENENGENYTNELYDIRSVGDHVEPDGTGTVEVEVAEDGAVEITHSEDAPESAGEAETVAEVAE